jgi:hypothetical protein
MIENIKKINLKLKNQFFFKKNLLKRGRKPLIFQSLPFQYRFPFHERFHLGTLLGTLTNFAHSFLSGDGFPLTTTAMIKCDPEEKRVRVGLSGGGRPNESEVFM